MVLLGGYCDSNIWDVARFSKSVKPFGIHPITPCSSIKFCVHELTSFKNFDVHVFQPTDPSENDTTMIPPLLGYAKPGAVNGTLLYVNYGRTEDFKVLKNDLGVPIAMGKLLS